VRPVTGAAVFSGAGTGASVLVRPVTGAAVFSGLGTGAAGIVKRNYIDPQPGDMGCYPTGERRAEIGSWLNERKPVKADDQAEDRKEEDRKSLV
jgi:hypothetical protein